MKKTINACDLREGDIYNNEFVEHIELKGNRLYYRTLTKLDNLRNSRRIDIERG